MQFSSKINRNSTITTNEILYIIADSLTSDFSKNTPEIIFEGLNSDAYMPDNLSFTDKKVKLTKDIAWFDFENYSFAIQLFIPDTICDSELEFVSTFAFRGQEIYIHRDSITILYAFQNAQIYIDIYGSAKEFLTISRNDWKSYNLIHEVISKVKYIFENKNLNQETKDKLVYGFKYNKDLGINIIDKEINDKQINDKDIAHLKLEENIELNSILNKSSLIFGNKILTEKIISSFNRDKKFIDIKAFNTINSIYHNATIKFFIKNGFTVYKVAISGKLDSFRDILFLCKSDTHMDMPALYIDDYNVAVFTLVTEESVESNSYKNNLTTYRFIDSLKNFSGEDEGSTIYIRQDYDDYHLFYDFKDLEIPIPDEYINGLDDFYTSNGIIFPFYLESDEIKLHNLDLLCSFVHRKLNNTNLSISNIKVKYRSLILLIKELTAEYPKWNSFFRKNDI